MALNDFEDIQVTDGLVAEVAERLVALMRGDFTEAQLISMDHQTAYVYEPGIVSAGDYCDHNTVMAQAFEDALVAGGMARDRAYAFVTCSDDNATPDAQERRGGIWNGAWEKAQASGLSRLRAAVPDDDFRTLAVPLMARPRNHSGGYPVTPVDDVLRSIQGAGRDVAAAVQRGEVEPATLSDLAAAVRSGDADAAETLVASIRVESASPAP